MARPSKRQYLREIDRLSPTIRRQYLEWVRRRIDATSIRGVERWIQTANVEMIMRELGMTGASLSNITEAIRDSYKAGGKFEEPAFAAAPSAQFTFDIRNPGAELWLRDRSSKFVTGVMNSQRQAIAEALETGARNGKNPRSTALDIVGRTDSTGRRRGGIVGLNGPQSNAAGSAWDELSSGDPSQMRNYLTRKRRDRRFDAMVNRAIIEGRPLTASEVNRITGRYADRLLLLRGETIARTETIEAFNAARDQAWSQAIDEGVVRQEFIVSRWSATGDAKTRSSHSALNNQTQPHGQPFRSPLGSLMRYPGDTGLGALPEDTINCRCYLERTADFIAQEAAYGG